MTEMRIHYWKRVKEAIKYYDLVGQDLSILSEDEKHLVWKELERIQNIKQIKEGMKHCHSVKNSDEKLDAFIKQMNARFKGKKRIWKWKVIQD